MDEVSGARGMGEAKGDVIASEGDARSEGTFHDPEREFIERCEEFCEFVQTWELCPARECDADQDAVLRVGGEREICAIAGTVTKGRGALRAKKGAMEAYLRGIEGHDDCCWFLLKCACDELEKLLSDGE